ncbi:MAG: hypothetical protein ACRDGF_04620, partial [Chloroflexota bacterium]
MSGSGALTPASQPRPAAWAVGGAVPAGKIYLANVGVNASHRLRSPLHADGTFTLVTIPEPAGLSGASLRTYGSVPDLATLVPERRHAQATHYDPEFETRTYGDNCSRAARAAALRQVRPGDCIVFIARLHGGAGPLFALVGILEVEAILPNVRARPAPEEMRRFGANAHIRRALADPRWWDGFWVFAGTVRSGLLRRAVPIGRAEAQLLLRDRAGSPWAWPSARSDLQTIGSYTRTCRCVIDPTSSP